MQTPLMSPSDALDLCRAFAACAGEYPTGHENMLAEAVKRLLFEYTIAINQVSDLRDTLKMWGIPSQQAKKDKASLNAFDSGWERG